MKKLLSIIGAASVTATGASSVISCDPGDVETFATGDMTDIFTNINKIIINSKDDNGIKLAIKKLKVISSLQYDIKGTVDYSNDTGSVTLAGKSDFFLPVTGEVTLSWEYQEEVIAPEPGPTDPENPGPTDPETPNPEDNGNLGEAQESLDMATGFVMDWESQFASAEEAIEKGWTDLTDPVEYAWILIGTQVDSVFNTTVKNQFDIDPNNQDLVQKGKTYQNDWDKVIKNLELESQSITVKYWGTDGSWITGEATVTVRLHKTGEQAIKK
ncbi:lipoprotein [Spiroplasma culicicola]|uniref:Lipoprotein n=1 Tax=Spiroplasma culicicola AES-1 TaxID=1276246 RepID=W6A7K7_9MOLU|nr:lipoprotein [Spiroplasma culicicola]AHI52835.1 hypothetical protein SCULI_v1c04940 [Spiroplasma culicicola AES-1]